MFSRLGRNDARWSGQILRFLQQNGGRFHQNGEPRNRGLFEKSRWKNVWLFFAKSGFGGEAEAPSIFGEFVPKCPEWN
jgi:hypothetical protein